MGDLGTPTDVWFMRSSRSCNVPHALAQSARVACAKGHSYSSNILGGSCAWVIADFNICFIVWSPTSGILLIESHPEILI